MDFFVSQYSRRQFLHHLTIAGLSVPALAIFREETLRFLESGAYADELTRTPSQTEGPFYPDRLPLDTDNDLLIIGKSTTPADGAVTHLGGRVLDLRGEPIKGVRVEIWQVDHRGVYLHSGSSGGEKRDKNFQGFGRFETASDGGYRFRTIKPVPYPGRTPHIHVKLWKGERELLTTQLYIAGEPQNARDGVLQGIANAKQRASVIVPFSPKKGSKVGELDATFDIVLGFTPEA